MDDIFQAFHYLKEKYSKLPYITLLKHSDKGSLVYFNQTDSICVAGRLGAFEDILNRLYNYIWTTYFKLFIILKKNTVNYRI